MSAFEELTLEQIMLQQLEEQKQINRKLSRLLEPPMGFCEPPGDVWIYANRSHAPLLWYGIKDGEPFAYPHNAVCGYLKELKFERVERRGKESIKLQAFLSCGIAIESGHDSHFSKGLMSAIALVPTGVLQDVPVTIAPRAGTDENVLFCSVFLGGARLEASYGEETDWRTVAKAAVAAVGKLS